MTVPDAVRDVDGVTNGRAVVVVACLFLAAFVVVMAAIFSVFPPW